jgi:hypothetical protein
MLARFESGYMFGFNSARIVIEYKYIVRFTTYLFFYEYMLNIYSTLSADIPNAVAGRIRKCFRDRIDALNKGDSYVPACDNTGMYAPQQCDPAKGKCPSKCSQQRAQ